MDDSNFDQDFQLIASAGMSKSNSMEAIINAREGNFEKAHQLLKKAEENLNEAHTVHFQMLQKEASSEAKKEMSLIPVHAQDHLTMATIYHDMAIDIVNLYELAKK
jgi:Phosphotransferase system cellobiose-specific component IIA